ncbi:DUF2066 domain-containing protein [Pokkaliibacter sp. CJK22405]|uniref:DUF2066 domain-containing protein n=1 Tax=Pokkaliibacter sp. CJK22405 TaxID=3384615 RepID=UPI00398478DC
MLNKLERTHNPVRSSFSMPGAGFLKLVAVLLGLSSQVHAQVIEDYASAQVSMTANDATQQAAAQKAGVQRVLLRQLGDADLMKNPYVLHALDKPDDYIRDYQVLSVDNSKAPYALALNVDQGALDKLYQQASLTAWPVNRSKVVLWLAVQQDDGDRVLETNSPLAVALQQQAQLRGVPFVRPLLDLQDELAIDASRVWGGFKQPVQDASRRYEADAELIGRLTRNGDNWEGRWRLMLPSGEDKDFGLTAADREEMAEKVMDKAATLLSAESRLAQASQGGAYFLTVSNITDFNRLQRLENRLASLPLLSSYELNAVSKDQVEVKVLTGAERQTLINALTRDAALSLVIGGDEQHINLRWQGASTDE